MRTLHPRMVLVSGVASLRSSLDYKTESLIPYPPSAEFRFFFICLAARYNPPSTAGMVVPVQTSGVSSIVPLDWIANLYPEADPTTAGLTGAIDRA